VRSIVVDRELDDQAKMRGFWRKGAQPAIGNAELVHLEQTSTGWQHHVPPITAPSGNEAYVAKARR